VRGDHRDRVLLQGNDRLRRRRGRRARSQPGGRDRPAGGLGIQLRVHPDAAGHPPPDPGAEVNELLAVPREWVAAAGEIGSFTSSVVRRVWDLQVLRFSGEALRQAGILIISSTLVIWSLMFLIGLNTCGIQGAYFFKSIGAPAYAGVF